MADNLSRQQDSYAELRGRTYVGGESVIGGCARLRDNVKTSGRPYIGGNMQFHGRVIVFG